MTDDQYIQMKRDEGQPSNRDWLRAIKRYQSCPFVHPLTCGNDSQNHRLLKGVEIRGRVVLVCPDCDYRQENVPSYVFQAEHIDNVMEFEFKELYDLVKKNGRT